MKEYALAMVVCLLGCEMTAAEAGDWYVGAGGGFSHARDASHNVAQGRTALTDSGVGIVAPYDTKADIASVLGGYQFGPEVAAELSYDYLGQYRLGGVRPTAAGLTGAKERDQVNALTAAALFSLPVDPRLSIYGKLGVAAAQDRETCGSAGISCPSHSNLKAVPVLAGGGEVNFTPHSHLRLEIIQYAEVGGRRNEYTAGAFTAVEVKYLYRF